MHRLFLALMVPVMALAAGGCHDNSSTNPPPTPQPAAAFTVGGAQQVGQATTFDAATSTDPGGGGLSYTWSFGDGRRGGTVSVAHLFAQAGTYSVQLTVQDAAGTTATATKTVVVAAGPAPSGTATVKGLVTLANGSPLAGVVVGVVGSATSAQTAADGSVTLAGVPAGVPLVLRLTQTGHAEQVVRLAGMGAGSTDAYFRAALTPRNAASSLPVAENGGTATGPGGAKVVLPASALVRADGSAVTGAVDVAITPVDVLTQPEAFPGEFDGVQPNGTQTPLASLGLMEVVLSQAGQPLQIAPGRTATVEIPIYTGGAAAGQAIPLWSLDEATGLWVQEGTGLVVSNAGSPTGLALRAAVSHFSWWNVDIGYGPFTVNVRCFTLDAAGNPVPLTVGCWVRARQQQGTTPLTSRAEMLSPYERRPFAIYPNVSTIIEGAAQYGGIGSATVTGGAGTSQNVDIILSQPVAPPAAADVRLVVMGSNSTSRILASEGVKWYPSASPMTFGYAAAWDGSRWVGSGGFGGVVMVTSADGVAWTPASFVPPAITHVRALAWNGSMWVAGGGASGSSFTGLLTSSNGSNWSSQVPPPNGGPISSVAWNGTEWLAASDGLGLIASPDGVSWQHRPSPIDGASDTRIAWNGTHWGAAGHTGSGTSVFMISTDGLNWTAQPVALPNVRAVAWNGSYWLVGGKQGFARSMGGASWAVVSVPTALEIWDIAWTGSGWVAVGTGATSALVMTSDDGMNWTVGSLPLSNSARGVAYRRPVYPPFP